MTVIERIVKTCSELGSVDVGGIKLEEAVPALLDVTQLDLDIHVAIQPAAIAYYGTLKKEALRRLANLRRGYERWQKKKYAEAKASLGAGTGKTTMADIEARFIIDNEADIVKWENQLDRAQAEFDTLDVWFEAWKQKSFSIREHAGIEETERFNSSPSLGFGESGNSSDEKNITARGRFERIRGIIKQRRESENNKKES
jgi:hypothetical protein